MFFREPFQKLLYIGNFEGVHLTSEYDYIYDMKLIFYQKYIIEKIHSIFKMSDQPDE